jgi:ubiquinone biosynthesis protein
MSEQIGWRALRANITAEAVTWARTLPQLPRLAHRALVQLNQPADAANDLRAPLRRLERWLALLAVLLAALIALEVWRWTLA